MNFKKTYYILILALLMLGCDNRKTDKKVEAFETSGAGNEWLKDLAAKTPLNSQELIRLLPQQLLDMPLITASPNGTLTVIGTYSNDKDPKYSSTTITFTLVEGAGDLGFQHINAMDKLLNQETNQTSDEGWAKTTLHNNQKVLVKEQTKTKNAGMQSTVSSSIDIIKNQRFHINLTGRHLPGNQLTRALDEVMNLSFPE